MKKTAVLLDLGFTLHRLYRAVGNRLPTADEVHEFARRCVRSPDEELFRIYCYHCPPFGGTECHPLTRANVDFSATSTFLQMSTFIRELSLKDNAAFRAGELSFDGWVLKKRSVREIARTGRAPIADDFAPDLKQKRVDMKIGLDERGSPARRSSIGLYW